MGLQKNGNGNSPRIGFLTHGVWDAVGIPLWQGAMAAANARDAQLVAFVGGDIGVERLPFESQANVIYGLATPATADAFVVSASSVGGVVGSGGMAGLYRQFGDRPVVNISMEREGTPAVVIDNYTGMYDMVSHLITVHGRRRPAFIPGPWQNPEVRERHRAWADALRDHGVEPEDSLVTAPGDWTFMSGLTAAASLLAPGRPACDAIVAASDRMASGALTALKDAGYAVPDQVAVTGFNDSLDAVFSDPPLTTVHQPLFNLARRAVETAIDLARGRPAAACIRLPAMPIFRRSCGCGLAPRPSPAPRTGGRRRPAPWPERANLVGRVEESLAGRRRDLPALWAERLVEALEAETVRQDAGRFLENWEKLVNRLTMSEGTADDLQGTISLLFDAVLDRAKDADREWLEHLMYRARQTVSEAVKIAEVHQTWIKTQRLHRSLEFINLLGAATTRKQAMETLASNLSAVMVPGCVLAEYASPDDPLGPVRPLLVWRQGAAPLIEPDVISYPSRELAPAGFFGPGKKSSAVVLPLYFQEWRIGFAVFLVGTLNGETYENLRHAVCFSLQQVRTVRQRDESRAALEKAYAAVEEEVRKRTAELEREVGERRRAEAEIRRLAEGLEDRVRERTAELETANRELEAFSYSVSHDLRAPLRAMDGFARILAEEFGAHLPARAMRHVATITESARSMGRLIDGLLEFSRLSRQALARQTVRHADLVREALAAVRAGQPGRTVDVTVEALPDATGDPTLARQVWMNLIDNAFKFTRRSAPARIAVGSRTGDGQTAYYVRDNGIGFDMAYADKLFGVFQRLHRADEYEGTGVGLAIVQRIVARHGGRVWAEAEPGKGATFFFTMG